MADQTDHTYGITPNVWCEDCTSHIPANYASRDLCNRHPRHEGHGFVRRGEWANAPPFLFCRDVNNGACPLFEPKRDGEDDAKESGPAV